MPLCSLLPTGFLECKNSSLVRHLKPKAVETSYLWLQDNTKIPKYTNKQQKQYNVGGDFLQQPPHDKNFTHESGSIAHVA